MLSDRTIASFGALCDGIEAKCIRSYGNLAQATGAKMISSGNNISGSHLLLLDRHASEVIEDGAAKLFDALTTAVGVESIGDQVADTSQLQALYQERLGALGQALIRERAMRVKRIESAVGRAFELPEAEAAIQREAATYGAKIQLMVAGMTNHRLTAQATSNIFHIGTAGAVQTGANATAVVNQTNNVGTAQDLASAIAELIRVLREDVELREDVRSDAVDILEDVKTEAQKAAPNRSKVSALLSGVKDTISTIPSVAPAWAQVVAWYEALRSAVP